MRDKAERERLEKENARLRNQLLVLRSSATTAQHEKELAVERAEKRLLATKLARLQRESHAQDQIIEYAKAALDCLPVVAPPIPAVKASKKITEESAVLVISCAHIGEVVSKQATGGLNEYNFAIFAKRLEFIIDRTISYTVQNMSRHHFRALHVLFTGDLVTGTIHDELLESNELNIVEQATLGALVFAQALRELAAVFPQVICTCVVGNHGRVTKQRYFKYKQQVNWDYVAYTIMDLLLRPQSNVHFNIPLSFWAGVEIEGHRFHVSHGDDVRAWGRLPFYGLERNRARWMEIGAAHEGQFFEYFVRSHFHTKAVHRAPYGEDILNGSIKGSDEYALGEFTAHQRPVQLLFGVHRKYGKTWELPLDCDMAVGKSRYRYDRSVSLASQEV